MNNSSLTSGQKAAATRKANERAKKQAQAKKDAWATRRERYGVTGMSMNAIASTLVQPKGLTMDINGVSLFIEEGIIGKVVIGKLGIRITK
jgi:glucose/arabinose dehydrogenase